MKHPYEIELPGRIIWKCESLEIARERAIESLQSSIPQLYIYSSDSRGMREKLVISFSLNGDSCKICKKKEVVKIEEMGASMKTRFVCSGCGEEESNNPADEK